jgi:cytochrome c-type biogenesis protein CcmE
VRIIGPPRDLSTGNLCRPGLQELATGLRDPPIAGRRRPPMIVAMTRAVDPARRRRTRLVVALTAALLLAAALAYTTFTAASNAVTPSQLLAKSSAGRSYQLTGKVAAHSVQRNGDNLRFAIRDRNGRGPAVRVVYNGSIPDPFREGREVIVIGHMVDGRFVAKRDSLITKCPSKFTTSTPSGRAT